MFAPAALHRHSVPDKLVQNPQLKSNVNSSSYQKSVRYFPKCTALFNSRDLLVSRNRSHFENGDNKPPGNSKKGTKALRTSST